VLVASHAKPWQLSTNAERLDPYNGLLLAAHVDKLFDVGLIAFAKDGRLLRKPEVSDAVLRSLGLVADSRVLRLHARHLPYLAAHRDLYGFNSAA
jgi:putative restriction endonuclease